MSDLGHEAENSNRASLVRSCPRKQTLERTCRMVAFVPGRDARTCSKQHHYSITLSARAMSVGGISRPSAWAVFRLTMSSNFTARSIGKFPGGVPFRILSMKAAERK
jgi:hypothetical protein